MQISTKITAAIAVIAMLASVSSAFAGGSQLDNKSLVDVLKNKGVLSADEAKAVSHNKDGKLKLSTLFFIDGIHTKVKTNGLDTGNTTGFDLTRAYLTAKYYFNDTWLMRLTLDVHQESALGKRSNVFVKYAYVAGNFMPELNMRLGVIHTPWIDHEEHLWGHRFVSEVYVDKYKMDTSADAGFGLKGKLFGGLANYWVTALNGKGYTNIKPSKTVDYNAVVGFVPLPGMTFDFQYRNGFKGTKTFNGLTTRGAKQRLYQAMVTYGTHNYRVAGGYADSRINNSDVTGLTVGATKLAVAPGQSAKDKGYYFWAWGKIPGTSFGGFGRIEYKKLRMENVLNLPNELTKRYLIGLDYTPFNFHNITFSAVYDHTRITNRQQVSTNILDKTDKYGIYSQIEF